MGIRYFFLWGVVNPLLDLVSHLDGVKILLITHCCGNQGELCWCGPVGPMLSLTSFTCKCCCGVI